MAFRKFLFDHGILLDLPKPEMGERCIELKVRPRTAYSKRLVQCSVLVYDTKFNGLKIAFSYVFFFVFFFSSYIVMKCIVYWCLDPWQMSFILLCHLLGEFYTRRWLLGSNECFALSKYKFLCAHFWHVFSLGLKYLDHNFRSKKRAINCMIERKETYFLVVNLDLWKL